MLARVFDIDLSWMACGVDVLFLFRSGWRAPLTIFLLELVYFIASFWPAFKFLLLLRQVE